MNDKNNNKIGEVLKEANREIEPKDSWEALRGRIDKRLEQSETKGYRDTIISWQKLGLAVAACLLIGAGISIYLIGFQQGRRQRPAGSSTNLLSQADVDRLSFAFSQVNELFGQQSRWIMIGSTNNTQIGVAPTLPSETDADKVVVLRLAVNTEGGQDTRQYFDIVAYPNQQADLQLRLADASEINLSIEPKLKSQGKILLWINTRAKGYSQENVGTIVDGAFTSLVHIQANGDVINIEGTGRAISNI